VRFVSVFFCGFHLVRVKISNMVYMWQVLCVDTKKSKLAEAAVNKYCAYMEMPKAINQSSQLIDSPVSIAEGPSVDWGDAMPEDENTQFSQC